MANPIMKKINVPKAVNQAVGYAQTHPCKLCSCEDFCGIKYKGTCKIAMGIRIALLSAKKMEE